MAHRHKHHKAHGGRTVYSGAGSHVAHEAEEHKRGGHVKKHKKYGGYAGVDAKHHKHGGKVHGHHSKHRLDKRARGGGVGGGSDKHPFSSAGAGERTSAHPHPK